MATPDDPLTWPDDRHLTRAEAADFIRTLGFRMAVATLAKLACRGGGPPMTYFGARPFYLLRDLRAWQAGRLRRRSSTPPRSKPAEAGAGADDKAPAHGGDDAAGAAPARGKRPRA